MIKIGFWNVRAMNKLDKQRKFYYTIVYAFNGITEREPLWANIKRFRPPSTIPWVLGGDFNCVLLAEERLGGSFNLAEAEPFQQCLEDCEVMDLQASGSFYTWNNKQPPETRVYSRLDRALVNQGWTDHFPDMYANFLPEGHFDHSPCVIGQINRDHHRNRPFKYFNMWSMSPDFQACVDNIWKQNLAGTRMYRVTQKLRLLKPELKRINSTCYSDIENQAMLAATKLYQAQQHLIQQPGDRELMAQEYAAHQESLHLQQAKYEYLKQKAKAHWVTEGDINSSYFHGVIKARRNKNFIQQIRDCNGVLHSDEGGIQQAFLDYYQVLLGSSSPTVRVKDSIVQRGNKCTESHKQILLAPVNSDEIKNIIFSIPNDKAPGPDGYSSKFYKDSWETIGVEVTAAVQDFFASGCILKQINTTLVTLIPKVERPETVLQFRPIACCNVIYKCISKVICNRLATILPELVSQNQGGFIQGKSIIDNILICQDLIRLYERKASSPRCLFKMDLQKAYDTVEWKFLRQILTAMDFPS
ncbi:uncharacterized protein LOC141631286 [Silene latifolia]|uniref:uncharacterized protein LOC141631286 n=1 Tax=Silene latifolia TaxID=37657 RepID=UPI003D77A06F